jgi:hypothetical protein
MLDTELWIVTAAVELQAGLAVDAGLRQYASADQQALLQAVITSGVAFFEDSLVKTRLRDERGAPVDGLIIDPGLWATHPEHRFAGYEGETFPAHGDEKLVPTLSWDLSHSYRLVPALLGIAEHAASAKVRARFEVYATLFANQLAYAVFNGDLRYPRFRNFIDGSNGWYRVNYESRARFAYPPWSLSVVMLQAPYMRLADRQPRLKDVAAVLWHLAEAPSGPYCRPAREQYAVAEIQGDVRQPSRLFGPGQSGAMLSFIATLPVLD